MKKLLIITFFVSFCSVVQAFNILHLSFHKGCIKEFEAVAQLLGITVTSLFIHDLPAYAFDPASNGNSIYNIGHERAERIWNKHKDYFETFDAIITSDTAPLSRIFLQNNWSKPLIIWICNRFDYYDGASLDCDFPDKEYYDLINQAHNNPLVRIVAYTPFEHVYAASKGVNTGSLVIKPCAPDMSSWGDLSSVAKISNKSEIFFVPYYNNNIELEVVNICKVQGIKSHSERYNGPLELQEFKGIIHIPNAWSNLAFFENMHLGLPYFVPSRHFIKTLAKSGKYWHTDWQFFLHDTYAQLSEWHSPEHREIITYFNSWKDLKRKIKALDFNDKRAKILTYAAHHKKIMVERWRILFKDFMKGDV